MKKILFIFLGAIFMSSVVMAQPAKKPSLMVVPSRVWCTENGYMMTYPGGTSPVPDYRKAFDECTELNLVVSKIGQMMSDRGFDLKLMSAALSSLESEAAEDMLMTSKSGGEVAESPIDKLRKVAKADIWMNVGWILNKSGLSYTITFDLSGVDAYTDKQIANCQGTGDPAYTAEVPVLLADAVSKNLDNFNEQLMAKFNNWFDHGREISFNVKCWDDCGFDLEEEYNGTELGAIIEDWLSENTVEGQFTTDDATENFMKMSNVRIPMVNDDGKALDARSFGRSLQKMLKANYQIESKVMTKGLGSVTVVIGGK